MLRIKTAVLVILATLGGFACASTDTEKSTGSNWLECDDNADCYAVSGATCGDDGYCVDASGSRVMAPANAGGGGSGGVGVTGGEGGAAQAGSGGAAQGGNGGAAQAGSGGAAQAGNGGAAQGGGLPGGTVIVDCYSPNQNLDRAYEPGSVGCECPAGAPDQCISLSSPGLVALTCSEGRWQAVEDGACGQCWTPDDPDRIRAQPDMGCACDTEGETACSFSEPSGVIHAVCQNGKWTLGTDDQTPCACTSDVQCGFRSRCVDGTCLPGLCEVDSVRYAAGVQGIPDPLSCNTCECMPDGTLGCTVLPCPLPPACPEGTAAASVCLICGSLGGCELRRTGCQPTCTSNDECGLLVCDQSHCTAGPCDYP